MLSTYEHTLPKHDFPRFFPPPPPPSHPFSKGVAGPHRGGAHVLARAGVQERPLRVVRGRGRGLQVRRHASFLPRPLEIAVSSYVLQVCSCVTVVQLSFGTPRTFARTFVHYHCKYICPPMGFVTSSFGALGPARVAAQVRGPPTRSADITCPGHAFGKFGQMSSRSKERGGPDRVSP